MKHADRPTGWSWIGAAGVLLVGIAACHGRRVELPRVASPIWPHVVCTPPQPSSWAGFQATSAPTPGSVRASPQSRAEGTSHGS
jgi:hypothetical protein